MPTYIALLRAVNVGGTGKLPMAELKAIAIAAGFSKVQTYIASGNLIFETDLSSAKVKSILDQRLTARSGKPIDVIVRSAKEMQSILKANPFPGAAPNRTVVIFLDRPLPASAVENITGRQREELKLSGREIFVHYPEGIGSSKLRISAADSGTARNMNTVSKLIELAANGPKIR